LESLSARRKSLVELTYRAAQRAVDDGGERTFGSGAFHCPFEVVWNRLVSVAETEEG
jgi:hypothetical protein